MVTGLKCSYFSIWMLARYEATRDELTAAERQIWIWNCK